MRLLPPRCQVWGLAGKKVRAIAAGAFHNMVLTKQGEVREARGGGRDGPYAAA